MHTTSATSWPLPRGKIPVKTRGVTITNHCVIANSQVANFPCIVFFSTAGSQKDKLAPHAHPRRHPPNPSPPQITTPLYFQWKCSTPRPGASDSSSSPLPEQQKRLETSSKLFSKEEERSLRITKRSFQRPESLKSLASLTSLSRMTRNGRIDLFFPILSKLSSRFPKAIYFPFEYFGAA